MIKRKKQKETSNWFERLEKHLFAKQKPVTWVLIILSLIMSILLFDMKISIGGDDASYIARTCRFVDAFVFPTFQGPLYPIILSPFVFLFGINIFLLKLVSVLFLLGFVIFFLKAYKNTIPFSLLVVVLLIIIINPYIQQYASLTYTETCFMFFSALFFYLFHKNFIANEAHKRTLKKSYGTYLLIAGLIVALGLIRTAGFLVLLVVIAYFLLQKQWKPALFSLLAFFAIAIPYEILKNLVWDLGDVQFQSQLEMLLLKDPYRSGLGKEDLAGFFNRFFSNINLYISSDTYMFLGFRPDYAKSSSILTIFFAAVFIVTSVTGSIRSRHLLLATLFVIILGGATSIMLQARWHQYRLFMIYLPWILYVVIGGFYVISGYKRFKILNYIIPILLVTLFFKSCERSVEKVKENGKALQGYLAGNYLVGFTPDYVHYIKACAWAAENLPDSAVIACRKPSVSFIYSNGREFHGIFKVPSSTKEEFIQTMKSDFNYLAIYDHHLRDQAGLTPLSNEIRPYIDVYRMGVSSNSQKIGILDNLLVLYKFPDKGMFNQTIKVLEDSGTDYITDIEGFLQKSQQDQEISAVFINPDSLFNTLKRDNVSHVVFANFRLNPEKKSKQTINTLKKYFYWIERKYPGLLRQLWQEGTQEDEPAFVCRIIYH
ncbi:MAG: hypothetical protein HQ542_05710 [Bacteroidia bacterium]|nr:hypothetical protein [Bacteroidia bacterium]